MPEVDLGVDDQRVLDHRGVEQREVAQRLDGGPGDEGQVGQGEALLGLEALAPGLAHALDALEVDLVGDERVRRGRLGAHHVLGGAPAHVGERHDLVAGARGTPPSRRAAADGAAIARRWRRGRWPAAR